jgi:polysaccharide pyruvyl transferase WcaK-like protein
MKKICLWGTSLQKVADEAQVLALIKIINSQFPDAKITLFSKYGEIITELKAKYGFEITTIRPAHLHRVIRPLANCDLFIMAGGPFFEELFQTLICLGLFLTAKLFRRPVITYGATAFHFKTWWGRFLFRNMFDRMDAISVREKVTIDILDDLGVKKEVALFADPRFILEPVPAAEVRTLLLNEGINPDEPLIGLTTRYLHSHAPAWVKRSHSYSDDRVGNANEVLARAVAHLSELAQVLILPMHPSYDEDTEMAKVTHKYMKDPSRLKMLSRRYSSLEIMGIIQRCELLLACRLGSAVFATVTGTPVVAIAYEPRMMDHMERIQHRENVFDWKELEYDALVKRVREVWFSRDTAKGHMNSQVRGFKEMAQKNAEVVSEVLGQSHSVSTPATYPTRRAE